MPWALFNRPSIQLASLKGFLSQDSRIEVRNLHPYLGAAKTVGLDRYQAVSENGWAAEAVYSALLFPEMREEAARLYHRSQEGKKPLPPFAVITDQLRQHLDQWLARQDFSSTALVGLSVCFSQLAASLLAAREIKKQWPHLHLVLGGSSCTTDLAKSLLPFYPEIDSIVIGEGEQALAELIASLVENRPCRAKNIITAGKTADHPGLLPANEEIRDLDSLPLPEYQDYFTELREIGLHFIPVLPLEFSRGCWWNRCSFCNLNLQWCGYRFKSWKRMVSEVEELGRCFECLDFTFTDNALPPGEASDFFRSIAQKGKDYRFFAEIRIAADPDVYHLYRQGGLHSIQIGIEALADSLLVRMRKGTTAMDNVAALKFAAAAGLALDGNLILEFPGSTPEEVEETCRVLDLVLPYRPLKAASFFLGHGSPVWRDPASYGIRAILRHPHYGKLFPPDQFRCLDFLIKSYRADRERQRKLWQPVRKRIKRWHAFHAGRKQNHQPPLSCRDGGDFLLIRQERPDGPPLHHRLRGISREIYLACERPVEKNILLHRFRQVTRTQLFSFLNDLERKGLLYCSADSCLALALRTP